MATKYRDFEISIDGDGQITSKAGDGAGPTPPNQELLDRASDSGIVALFEQGHVDTGLELTEGLALYEALLPTPIRTHLVEFKASGEGPVRLRLDIQPPELKSLPWELLCDEDGRFLGLSPQTPIVRGRDVSRSPEGLLVHGPVQVLVMIAGPTNFPRLNLDALAEQLKSAFAPHQAAGILEVDFLPHVTLPGLMRRLRSRAYHVLYFVGYTAYDGEQDRPVLLFEHENGVARKVGARDLDELLRREDPALVDGKRPTLRLVVVNQCRPPDAASPSLALPLAEALVCLGAPAAVAMRFALPDWATCAFAGEFATALAHGQPLEVAVVKGRAAIREAEPPGEDAATRAGLWPSPVLIMSGSDGHLVVAGPATKSVATESDEEIQREIREFKVIPGDPPTRFFLQRLEVFILLTALATAFYNIRLGRFDSFFTVGVAVAFACVWLLRDLFRRKVPDTFESIWRQHLLGSPTRDLAKDYRGFLRDYNSLLNNRRYVWLTRLIGMAVAGYSALHSEPSIALGPARGPLWALLIVLELLGGYVIGTLLWKMVGTVVATRWLSYRFQLDVHPGHPDRCGGLKPLGDLYFAHAWVVLLAGLYVAAWVVILGVSGTIVSQWLAQTQPEQAALVERYPMLCADYAQPAARPRVEPVQPASFSPQVCRNLGIAPGAQADEPFRAPSIGDTLRSVVRSSGVRPPFRVWLQSRRCATTAGSRSTRRSSSFSR